MRLLRIRFNIIFSTHELELVLLYTAEHYYENQNVHVHQKYK